MPGREVGVVVSRIKRAGAAEVETATEQTLLHRGDIILAVGTRRALEKYRVVIGKVSDFNLAKAPGRVISRKIVVTHKEVLGKSLDELDLDDVHEVAVTRINRADIEMTAIPALRLQFGDVLQVVGEEQAIARVAKLMGNSVKTLNETNFIPIFIGIALGVLFGSMPIHIPNMPVPVRLGIAGGPLLLGVALMNSAQYADALKCFERSAALAKESVHQSFVQYLALANVASCALHLHDVKTGIRAIRRAIELNPHPSTAADCFARANAESNYGPLQLEIGEVGHAQEHCDAARKFAAQAPTARAEYVASITSGLVDVHSSTIDIGLTRLKKALEHARQSVRAEVRDALSVCVAGYATAGQPDVALL